MIRIVILPVYLGKQCEVARPDLGIHNNETRRVLGFYKGCSELFCGKPPKHFRRIFYTRAFFKCFKISLEGVFKKGDDANNPV